MDHIKVLSSRKSQKCTQKVVLLKKVLEAQYALKKVLKSSDKLTKKAHLFHFFFADV